MIKIAACIFLCLLHVVSTILTEAFLAVAIIWFWDYSISFNISIAVCFLIAFALHYWGLFFLSKRKIITYSTSRFLLLFDIMVCLSAFLAILGCVLYFTKIPYVQLIFAISINLSILLARILVCRRLKLINRSVKWI